VIGDTAAWTYKHNYEYYLLKHLSHFVNSGAKRLETFTLIGDDNVLAFTNPAHSVVVFGTERP
jgi:glucosylceramidase